MPGDDGLLLEGAGHAVRTARALAATVINRLEIEPGRPPPFLEPSAAKGMRKGQKQVKNQAGTRRLHATLHLVPVPWVGLRRADPHAPARKLRVWENLRAGASNRLVTDALRTLRHPHGT